MYKNNIKNAVFTLLLAAFILTVPNAYSEVFLVNRREDSSIWRWDTADNSVSLYHSTTANDVDFNPEQGSQYGWIAEHHDDYFARFIPGTASGYDSIYKLRSGGHTHYSYPKHITVFNNNIVIMSRNDATIWRYDDNGNEIVSHPTNNDIGQGMATDGTDLFVSIWDESSSYFQKYDSSFTLIETIANPTGMNGYTNIVDFAYDNSTGHFFGLATDYEQGTATNTRAVLEFTMGGQVIDTHFLPFSADGIGQIPEPASLLLMGLGFALIPRKKRCHK